MSAPATSITLADLVPGQQAIVAGFMEYSPLVQRIMQLGLLQDSPVRVVRRAPAGDPIEVEVMGYALSLRLSEARKVLVRDVC